MSASSGRFSLRPVIRRQYEGLQDASTGKVSFRTWLSIVGLPVLIGGLAGFFIQPITNNLAAPSPTLPLTAAGGALTTGFLASFVLLTNLRIKLLESPQLPQTSLSRRSVSQAAMTSLYLVASSATFLLLALGLGVFWTQLAITASIVARIWFGITIAVLLHTLINAVPLVRRSASVYLKMFGSELGPELRAVTNEDRKAG